MSEGEGNTYWKTIARPITDRGVSQTSLMSGPPAMSPKTLPAVAPKPGGKMYVYMYETPEPAVRPQNGPKLHYPRSNECVKYDKAKWKQRGQRYVPETSLRNNSRGGRMFEKQKNRMDEYVLTSPVNNRHAFENNQQPSNDSSIQRQRVTYTKVQSKPVPIGSRNMPAFVNNTMVTKSKRKMSGPVIRPLRSPPPEWKAKVDANYNLTDASFHPAKYWEQENLYEAGYDSAPPKDTNYEDFDYDEDQAYARSLHESRTDSRGIGPPPVTYYFNAKTSNKPKNFRRKRISQAAYVGAPYTENDFNASAVGWSRMYAERY